MTEWLLPVQHLIQILNKTGELPVGGRFSPNLGEPLSALNIATAATQCTEEGLRWLSLVTMVLICRGVYFINFWVGAGAG